MIRKFLLASVGAIALSGSAALAAVPRARPPPVYLPPVPIFTGQIGYAWTSGNNSLDLIRSLIRVPFSQPRSAERRAG